MNINIIFEIFFFSNNSLQRVLVQILINKNIFYNSYSYELKIFNKQNTYKINILLKNIKYILNIGATHIHIYTYFFADKNLKIQYEKYA